MAEVNANKARYFFETPSLAQDVLQVVDFIGQEGISQLFRFEINLVSEEPDISFDDLVNSEATLTMMRGDDPVKVHGIVSDFQQGGKPGELVAYRVTMVPRLWRLTLNYQSRVFQNMTVEEIITQLLAAEGLSRGKDFNFSLKGKYKPREYTVQYRETDFNFICRLLEFEGIYFFFDHRGGTDLMVITDDRSEDPTIEGDDRVTYHTGAGMIPDTGMEMVSAFVCKEKIVTGKVVLKDYNYRTPEVSLQSDSQLNQDMPGTYYEFGQHFKDGGEGTRLAKVRNQELECTRRIMTGASDCCAFRSGFVFTLEGHYRKGMDGDFLLVAVSHSGSQGSLFASALSGKAPTYANEFVCIPADVQFRPPRRTQEPIIPGVMTARVESSGGQYAHLDDEGRYRVKMHFDLSGKGQATASRSIRLAQPYTGSNYGIHFPVYEGTELVWACVDGNVDRPLGLATVPNPSRSSPVKAANRWQNIIRTAAGNELVMDDKAGETQVFLKTTDAHKVLLDDKDDKVEIVTTNSHRVVMDDKNQNITVKTKDGHLLTMDDKNTKIALQSKNGHRLVVSDAGGSESITVSDKAGDNSIVIDISNNKLVIMTKNGSIDLHAPNGTIDIKATELKVETKGDTSFKAANIKSEAQADYKVKGTNVSAEAAMEYKEKAMNIASKADMNAECKAGMNMKVEGGMNLEVKGGMMTSVQGGAMTKVAGGIVMIN